MTAPVPPNANGLRGIIQQAAEMYLSDFDTVMNVRSEARDLAVAIDRALAASTAGEEHRAAAPAAAPADANGLREDEYELLCTDERDADEHTVLAVERIVAARESAAATRARAEGAAEALREAADDARKVYIECESTYRGSCRTYDQGVADAWDAAADGLRDRADSIAHSDAAPHTGGQS